MRNQEFTAKTVEDALNEALKAWDLKKEDVTYEVITEPSKGFLGIGSKNAVIKVEEKYSAERVGKKFLLDTFKEMGLEADVAVSKKDDYLLFEIIGENMGIIIGRRGDTLDALQFLLNLVLNKESGEKVKGIIDIENYRAKREESLENLAIRLAAKARRTGRKVILEPMNPQERRIIHMVLQDDKTVSTFSEGEEPYRKVIIVPKNTKRNSYKKDYKKPYKKDYKKPYYNKEENVVAEEVKEEIFEANVYNEEPIDEAFTYNDSIEYDEA